jgi:FixJ family two-component response regulator
MLKQAASAEMLTAINQVRKVRTYVTAVIAGGLAFLQTAEILNISPKTVEFHKCNLMLKFNLKTTSLTDPIWDRLIQRNRRLP